ncbi:MAG: hypothetical protein MJZ18_07595 [Bacteroidales bacterium]|nr:hypothetical protein [Bacteroidales bacterium]
MKKILLTLIAVLGISFVASAQCGDDLMKKALTAMGSNQYIKDFDLKLAAGAADGVTFTVVLNSQTKYQMNIANGASNGENVKIQIMDAGGAEIGQNVFNGKVMAGFQFKCSKTGAYKLRVSTENASEACARAVLSLVEQY